MTGSSRERRLGSDEVLEDLAEGGPTAREDHRLVSRALAGSAQAGEELARRLECVHRFIRYRNERLGAPLPHQDLADLIHDSIEVVGRKLGEFEGRARLETWVFRICNFELMNAVRDRRRRAARSSGTGALEAVESAGAAEPLAPEIRYERLYRGISRLSPDEEAVLRRRYYEDRSLEDIARELGLTLSGVKYRYYRALRHLRQLMGGPRGELEA